MERVNRRPTHLPVVSRICIEEEEERKEEKRRIIMTIDDFEAMVRIKMVEKAAMEEVGTKQALKVEIQSES